MHLYHILLEKRKNWLSQNKDYSLTTTSYLFLFCYIMISPYKGAVFCSPRGKRKCVFFVTFSIVLKQRLIIVLSSKNL